MKTLGLALYLTAAALFLCGCFQIEDELTVQPDGSGTIKLTVQSDLPEEVTGVLGMSGFGGGGSPVYPPSDEAEAKRFFPAKDFTVKTEQKNEGSKKSLLIEAAFKDVNAMLSSAYGRAHQLSLATNANGTLKLRTLSGGALLAQAAQFKPEGEAASYYKLQGFEEAQKKKGEMRFVFRVVLPNTISEASGSHENKTVSWVVERAKCKDDDEFANKLSGVLEASCSSQGLKFSPATPPRLGLVPFQQLSAGKSSAGPTLPDTNKIVQAARFVPYSLQVTRSLDLSGEGSSMPSQARLTGAILVPADLAPQRWGVPKLEEATDGKGNSLMPKENEEGNFSSRYDGFGMNGESDDEDQDDSDEKGKPAKSAEKPHMVALNFKAPEWKMKKIGRIKGVVELQYLGGSEIVKLTNAVPASLVMDMSKGAERNFSLDSDRGQIGDSRLAELGLSLKVQMAMVQSGMTTLSIEITGGKAALMDAQLFDAEGRAWPTTFSQADSGGGEDHSCQLFVAGKPKPPFSLAVAVGGVGASIAVPILVENVPVGDK